MQGDANQAEAWGPTRQIAYMRDAKGIAFGVMDEDEAAGFLTDRNYFFKVKAFCKNYEKYAGGSAEGRYVNLDFAYLVELSRLDKHLRTLVLDLTLDIEHYLKVRINASAMRCGADPLRLAEEFLDTSSANVVSEQARSIGVESAAAELRRISETLALQPRSAEEAAKLANKAMRELESVTLGRNPDYIRDGFLSMEASPYSRDLVRKYGDTDVPYWCLMELMSFGSVIKLYKSCFSKDGLIEDAEERDVLRRNRNLLRCSQVLRNAAAHNDCLMNGLSRHKSDKGAAGVRRKLVEDYGFDKALDAETLSNAATVRIAMDVAAVLMCYDAVVPKGQTRSAAAARLQTAGERFAANEGWFSKNYHVASFLKYATRLFSEFSETLGDDPAVM